MPTYPWNHPTGWIRRDLYAAEDGDYSSDFVVGMSLETLRESHLDRYGVDIGIVEPDEAAVFSLLRTRNWPRSSPPRTTSSSSSAGSRKSHGSEGCSWYRRSIRRRPPHEIRRIGGRDEFVGVFLPGAARVPYGNPMYDPMWEAVDELGLVVGVHTHFEGVGIAGPVTAAGVPDYYVEYHTLCGSGMYGHFVSILCHGIFERFPHARLAMVEGGLVPFVGLLWRLDTNWKACRTEIPWCRRRPSEYVWEHVRFASQPLESPEDPALLAPALAGLRPWDTLMYASDFPHWDFDEPEQTLRQLPEEWRDAVRSKNAIEFFRLPAALRHERARGPRPERSSPTAGRSSGRRDRHAPHRLYRVGDSVYALADRCPHRGAPLCAGAVATPIQVESGELTVGEPDSVVRCPWHKWEFDIATGRCTVDERLRVRQYPVSLDGDDVVVSLDKNGPHDEARRS